TLVRELWPSVRRDRLEHFAADLGRWRCEVYNMIRPHEALGDRPPITCWRPSRRARPSTLPKIEYPRGALVRKVASTGDIAWRGTRILVGRGLTGEWVELEPTEQELVLRYGRHEIRRVALANLGLPGRL